MSHWSLLTKPANVRLKVAFMADAWSSEVGAPMLKCDPDNGLGRFMSNNEHPYTRNWARVIAFYGVMGFDKLCDAEILERYNAAVSAGFTVPSIAQHPAQKVPAAAVAKATKRWYDWGWFRYEQRRAGRRRVARRAALPVLALFGIPMISA